MTTEKYLKREDIQNVNVTLKEFLTELRERTQAETDKFEVHQICIQLYANRIGKVWKMFVYFNSEDDAFYFSYQDEDYEDTDFTFGYDYDQMMQQMVNEIVECDFEWIELV